jgi:toxin YoeB
LPTATAIEPLRAAQVHPGRHGTTLGLQRQGTELVTGALVYSRQALKDAKKLKSAGLKPNTQELLDILKIDPFQAPPAFEKLAGDLAGAYSRRINIHHRLVYEVFKKKKTVRVLRMWTHYDE